MLELHNVQSKRKNALVTSGIREKWEVEVKSKRGSFFEPNEVATLLDLRKHVLSFLPPR